MTWCEPHGDAVADALAQVGWRVHRVTDAAGVARTMDAVVLRAVVCPDGPWVPELLHAASPDEADVPLVVLLPDPDLERARSLLADGVFHVLAGVTDLPVRALVAVERAAAHQAALLENRRLQRALSSRLDELSIARDRALAASRTKSAFLASMSHELRTPLNAILGYAELLDETLHADQDRRDLAAIRRAGAQLLSLVDDVLDLAKVESGNADLQPELVDVYDLLEEVVVEIRPVAQRRGNEVVLQASPAVGVVVADRRRLRQCLLNLLSNAAKFTQHGRITVAASPTHDPDGAWMDLSVEDTGIGMSPEECVRVFEPFTQANPSTGPTFGGTGLGLAITRELVRAMGGDIQVTSVPRKGSRFTLTLPTHGPPG